MNGKIWCVTGTLGGGKTTYGVELGCEAMLAGARMFTNIEMYPDKIAEWMATKGRKFDPERLTMMKGSMAQFHTQLVRGTAESPVICMLDEASLDFNARDWENTSRDLLAFVNYVRKLDIHLIFITQAFEDLDKQFRKRVAEVFVCRNMKHLKLWGVIPFPLPFFFRVRFDNTNGREGRPTKLDSEVVFKSWAWGLFDSNALAGKGAEKFGSMATYVASPLQKIPKLKLPKPALPWAAGLSACAASFSFLVA